MTENNDIDPLDVSDREQRLYDVLLRVVLPIGTAVWAFRELWTQPHPPEWVGAVLLVLIAAGIFVPVNYAIRRLDERLNRQDLIDVRDL